MPETKLRFLGSQIRAARKRNHLTQQKLADKTGLAIKTVQETEKGKKKCYIRYTFQADRVSRHIGRHIVSNKNTDFR